MDPSGWLSRRPLSQAADIDGVRSITVVDRLARATVWSMTFAPARPPAPAGPPADGVDGIGQARIADDVLDTVRAVELLFSEPEAAESWFEVILISGSSYHILRRFGAADDALVVELRLDARLANLAAARQQLDHLLAPYRMAEAASPAQTRGSADDVATAPDLPRRDSAGPSEGPGPPEGPVDEPILLKVAAALRRLDS